MFVVVIRVTRGGKGMARLHFLWSAEGCPEKRESSSVVLAGGVVGPLVRGENPGVHNRKAA